MPIASELAPEAVHIESYRSVRDAASMMTRHDVDALSVVSEQGVCGIYTRQELVADVAAGADLNGTIAQALKRAR